MANPEIIGLNQLPIIPASELTGEVLVVAVRDGQDVLVNAADIGVEAPSKESLGLDQVDNTSDLNKPLSTAAIARFQVIESALSEIDPDAGFDGGNIIGRAEYEADQATAAEALDVVRNSIPSTEGLVTATELTEALAGIGAPDPTNYALKSELPDLTPYAKTEDLPAPVDVSGLATKSELGDYVKAVDLPAAPDLSGYALKTELPDLSPYVKAADLPAAPDLSGFVTGEELTSALSDYVKTSELPGPVDTSAFATKTELADYVKTTDLPAAPDLTAYALKTEIPDVSGLATVTALQAVADSIPTLDGYVAASDLALSLQNYVLSDTLVNYALKSELPDLSGYALRTELPVVPESGFASVDDVTQAVNDLNMAQYAKTTDLEIYVTHEQQDTALAEYTKTVDLAAAFQRMPTFTLQNVSMNNSTNEITGEVLVDWHGYYCNGMSLDFLVNTEASPFSPPTQPFAPNQIVQSFTIAAQPDRPTQLIVAITDSLSPSFVTDNLIVDFPGV